jgi:hypothetical protein
MSQTAVALFSKTAPLPADFLNAYEIVNASSLKWPVAIYRLDPTNGVQPTHEDRGEIKNAIWQLRTDHKSRCRGYGFVIDISKRQVAVPESWDIPSGIVQGNYHVTREQSIVASALNPQHEPIVAGIIREVLKKSFKEQISDYLGCLWQDMDKFCQLPKPRPDEEFCMCRRFGASAKVLRGKRWVVECIVGTATIDGKTISDYYREGRVHVLAEMIQLKQGTRVDRRNQPIAVRVLQDATDEHNIRVRALDISDPSTIFRHADLSEHQQQALSNTTLACSPYKRSAENIPLSELRLILDSQITQQDHSETIVDPDQRLVFMEHMRRLIDGADAFGQQLSLAETPFDMHHLDQGFILPPSVRVMGPKNKEIILPAPSLVSDSFLRSRFKDRAEHIRQNGFLEQRPINPLLAWPTRCLGGAPAKRMASDLNHILDDQDVGFRFEFNQYDSVEDLQRLVERGNYDALLAVLPESSRVPHKDDSTHEQIKRRIDVPSQCIQYDHTLPSKWITRAHSELLNEDSKLARRIRQRYELCIGSLLIKHNWVPFAPADPFSFNVHIGIDVGGTHNSDAFSCLGYGFRRPHDGLIFRPDEIPINVQKAEPIPTQSLYSGLLRQFEVLRSELIEAGKEPDFERVLFYRDGPLHGEGDAWNEKDALIQLHSNLMQRGWVSPSSVWTATEIMKYAEGWRLFRGQDKANNPIAGKYVFAFDDEDLALVCTTGSQSLTQGTACPLMVRMIDIHGHSNRREIIQDIVWQADMCFTKPDVGMRLPWVLHVADVGALQRSRSYRITGITT